jgi:hypothetical protein
MAREWPTAQDDRSRQMLRTHVRLANAIGSSQVATIRSRDVVHEPEADRESMFQLIFFGGGLLSVMTPIILFPLRRRVWPGLRRRSGLTYAELSCFLLAFGALCLGSAYTDGIPYGHFRDMVGRWITAACVAMFIWMVTLANVAGRRFERRRVQTTAPREVNGDVFLILPGAKDQDTDAAGDATDYGDGPVARAP